MGKDVVRKNLILFNKLIHFQITVSLTDILAFSINKNLHNTKFKNKLTIKVY